MHETNLARLLAQRPDGIFIAPFEQGAIGPDQFRAACRLGVEASRSRLSRRSVASLYQREEPQAFGYGQGKGGV
jgi:hypothetical protein